MQAKVATIPGIVFGPHGEGHLRFSYSTSIENIEAAWSRSEKISDHVLLALFG